MPFISTERVKEIREQLKKEFPAIKFSVTTHHHSTVCVAIMESPYDWGKDHMGINAFYLHDYPHAELLEKIKSIANAGNGTLCEDGDYGTIPRFYFDLSIGKWDRPHRTIGIEK